MQSSFSVRTHPLSILAAVKSVMGMGKGIQYGRLISSRKQLPSPSLSSQWTLAFGMLLMLSLIFLMLIALRILSIPISCDSPNKSAAPTSEKTITIESEVEEKRKPWVEILSWEPRVFRYHNFLSEKECKHLILIGKPYLKNSSRKGTSNSLDPNSGVFLKRGQDETVKAIEKRISDFSFVPQENGEGLQVLRYDPGLKYEIHFDYFNDEFHSKNGRERMATLVMYLTDTEEGGETIFPIAKAINGTTAWSDRDKLSECAKEAALAAKPKKGDAVLFWNLLPDAKPDTTSLHGGCPVILGEKWTSTKFMRVGEIMA